MSAPSPPPPPTVVGDRWPDLAAADLGSWTPTRHVSVVVVARRDEPLEALVAALRRQTYPRELLDVVVVAEGDAVPPAGRDGAVTVVTPEPDEPAEMTGVRAAGGEVVCFLGPSAPVADTTIEAHARWHHEAAWVATLGWLDPGGWLDRYREGTADLSARGPDHFRAVDVRGLALGRELLDAAGGVRDLGDTRLASLDLGWRLWCAGALLVPEPFPTPPPGGGDERPPRSPRLVPPDRRRLAPLPRGSVPAVVAHVPARGASPDAVAVTVDALLASDVPGVAVRVEDPGTSSGGWADERVAIRHRGEPRDPREGPSPGWTPAAVQVWVPPGVVCAAPALRLLAEELPNGDAQAWSLTVPGLPPAEGTVLAVATRALSRAERVAATDGEAGRPGEPVLATVDRLFGHRWVGGERVGLAHWRPGRAVTFGDVPPGARIDTDVARRLAKRLDGAEEELAAVRARARRLDGDRAALKERLAGTRKQVRDRDRRLARSRSEHDLLRIRTVDAERRAAAAERRAAAVGRRRVVRFADAVGRLARARRPGTAVRALRDLARAVRR